jgi:hypothetical protein
MPTILKPILESSPTGFAKCTKCRQRIQKGRFRYGIPEFHQRLQKEIHRYYHEECIPDDMKERLNHDGTKERFLTTKAHEDDVLVQGGDLREQLRSLRSLLAREHGYEPYIIFNDATLNDLVIKLPTTKTDLKKIYGIKAWKSQHYGGPILEIIRQYRRQNKNEKAVRRNQEVEFAASVQTENVNEEASSCRVLQSGFLPIPAAAAAAVRTSEQNDDGKPEADKVPSTASPKQEHHSDCVPELVPSELHDDNYNE